MSAPRPDGVPAEASYLPPTPFFPTVRDATVQRVAAIVAGENSRTALNYQNALRDWQTNNAIYISLGMPPKPKPAAPDYQVLLAVWTDPGGNVEAVACSAPGADPGTRQIVPTAFPEFPDDSSAWMWELTINRSVITGQGPKGFLPAPLQKYITQ